MPRHPVLCNILIALACAGAALAQEGVEPTPEPDRPLPDVSCAEAIGGDDAMLALAVCRAEFSDAPVPSELRAELARLEYQAGDPIRAADLWEQILEDDGWTAEGSLARAKALWRGGEVDRAEEVFRTTYQEHPEPGTATDLIAFLLAFSRWDEAETAALDAIEAHPDVCSLRELLGMAHAGRGDHAEAADAFEAAIGGGCPPYRWATVGPVPEALDEPAYRPLLTVERLTDGLETTDDDECELRLRLLAMHPQVKAAPAATREVLERTSLEVRFAGLGLITQLGPAVMDSWEQLLASDDFILRKYTLRRIRELQDEDFIPLLEKHLEREELPGNRHLTALTLGEVLLAGPDPERGRALILSVPEDSALRPVGLMTLADHAEAEGDLEEALRLLEQALESEATDLHVDRDRLEKLRSATRADETP